MFWASCLSQLGAVNNPQVVKQTGQISYSFYMQETVNWSSELTLSREKVVTSEEYSIADSKQTDFGFRVDAQTEDPLRPDSPCPSGLSAWPCHGWDLLCWLPADWLVWSPCSPRDSPASSPTPQFKSINSSALSLLYGPVLTSIHDCWKNHSFD